MLSMDKHLRSLWDDDSPHTLRTTQYLATPSSLTFTRMATSFASQATDVTNLETRSSPGLPDT